MCFPCEHDGKTVTDNVTRQSWNADGGLSTVDIKNPTFAREPYERIGVCAGRGDGSRLRHPVYRTVTSPQAQCIKCIRWVCRSHTLCDSLWRYQPASRVKDRPRKKGKDTIRVPFLWNSLWMEKLFFSFNRKNSLEEFELFEFFLKKKRLCASLHKMLRFATKFGEIVKSSNVYINDSNIIILLTYVKSSLRKF